LLIDIRDLQLSPEGRVETLGHVHDLKPRAGSLRPADITGMMRY
jgi:hypothetical protein